MRRGPARSRAQTGATAVEAMFGLGLLVLLAFIAFRVTQTTAGAVTSAVSSTRLDQDAHGIADRLARELMQAGSETILPAPVAPLGASTLTYQRAESIAAGAVVWSSMRRVELVPDPTDPEDGTDNNGNGLVDEQQIHLVTDAGLPGERRVVLARRVASFLDGETENVADDNENGLIDERGLCFELRDGVLLIRVSVQGVGRRGGVLTRTAETGVHLRN